MTAQQRPTFPSYEQFLAADPRRRGDALECGHDWTDEHDHRHRVCWYAATGELTLERLSTTQPLELEDFAAGIAGPVEVLAHYATRADLQRALGTWPQLPHIPTRRVDALRTQLRRNQMHVVR